LHETSFEYDDFNRLIKTRNPENSCSVLTLDTIGQVVAVRDFDEGLDDICDPEADLLLTEVQNKYDEFGSVFQTEQAWIVDGAHANPTHTSQLTPTDSFATSRVTFDERGNTVKTIDDNKGTITFQHDGLGRLTQVQDNADPDRGEDNYVEVSCNAPSGPWTRVCREPS